MLVYFLVWLDLDLVNSGHGIVRNKTPLLLIEKHKAKFELEKEDKLDNLETTLKINYQEKEDQLKSDYDLKIINLKHTYDQKYSEQEKLLLSDFNQKSEKFKETNSKNMQILNEQKDDLDKQLNDQLQRIQEQHDRKLDEINESNFEKLSRRKEELNLEFRESLRKLEESNAEDLEKRKSNFKTQHEAIMKSLKDKLNVAKIELENEQQSLDHKKLALDNEIKLFETKEFELREKMADLEIEFDKNRKFQEKLLHEALLELTQKRDNLDALVNEKKLVQETLSRENERLKIENNNWRSKIEQQKDEYLTQMHKNDVMEIKDVGMKVRSLAESLDQHYGIENEEQEQAEEPANNLRLAGF